MFVTPYKQQLTPYEDDVRRINERLAGDAPVTSLSLVGRRDLSPYVGAGLIDPERENTNVYAVESDLREGIEELIEAAYDDFLDRSREYDAIDRVPNETRTRLKRERLEALVDRATAGSQEDCMAGPDGRWTAPYRDEIPTFDGRAYCPFYAATRLYKAENPESHGPLYPSWGVIDRDRIVREATGQGVHPHSAMFDLIGAVDLVIGNYNHLFDPITEGIVREKLDLESTFVAYDEAHNLVDRVRDLRTVSRAESTFRRATGELRDLVSPSENATLSVGARSTYREWLRDADVTRSDLDDLLALFDLVEDTLSAASTAALEEELESEEPDSGGGSADEFYALPRTVESGLQDPERDDPDRLTDRVLEADLRDVFEVTPTLATAIHQALGDWTGGDDPEAFTLSETVAVCRSLARWVESDNVRYFRQIVLSRRENAPEQVRLPRDASRRDLAAEWQEYYDCRVELRLCLPDRVLAHHFEEIHSGLLMSATLYPFDAFARTVGIERCREQGTVVGADSYELPFPEANRESFAVNAAPFTYRSRGPTPNPSQVTADGTDARTGSSGPAGSVLTDAQRETRRQYARVLKATVAETSGNTLIAMPSYAEAEWAAVTLRAAGSEGEIPERPILCDEPSSNAETEALKEAFFAGGASVPKVLVTGLRGTLVEGVDYKGDRLAAAVVCGVPIAPARSESQRAIRFAYEHAFGEAHGYEYAFTLPAVRRARQAMGRVIRGESDVGIRLLVDRRYATTHGRGAVRELLPPREREEFRVVPRKRGSAVDIRASLALAWEALDASE